MMTENEPSMTHCNTVIQGFGQTFDRRFSNPTEGYLSLVLCKSWAQEGII